MEDPPTFDQDDRLDGHQPKRIRYHVCKAVVTGSDSIDLRADGSGQQVCRSPWVCRRCAPTPSPAPKLRDERTSPPTDDQARYLTKLAAEAGVPRPRAATISEADREIKALLFKLRNPAVRRLRKAKEYAASGCP